MPDQDMGNRIGAAPSDTREDAVTPHDEARGNLLVVFPA